MIIVVTFSFVKSQYLAWMLNKSLTSLGIKHVIYFDKDQYIDPLVLNDLNKNNVDIRYKENYEGGHGGWPDSMQKINAYRDIVKDYNLQNDDWLLDMDDDTYMCNDSILKLLTNNIDLVGIQHEIPQPSKIGIFAHMSGACMCMRGEILLKLLSQSDSFWTETKDELLDFCFSHMWDVVVSYCLTKVGARSLNMSKVINMESDSENYFLGNINSNFFHFNYVLKEYLGEPTPNGKYDIPMILHKKSLI